MAKYKVKDRVMIPAEVLEVHEDNGSVWYTIIPMNCEPADALRYGDSWDGWNYKLWDMSENCILGKYEEA